MDAMPQTAKDRPEIAPGRAVDMSLVRLIEAVLADIRPTEPAPFQHNGAKDALAGPVVGNLARRATGSALTMRNRP